MRRYSTQRRRVGTLLSGSPCSPVVPSGRKAFLQTPFVSLSRRGASIAARLHVPDNPDAVQPADLNGDGAAAQLRPAGLAKVPQLDKEGILRAGFRLLGQEDALRDLVLDHRGLLDRLGDLGIQELRGGSA